MSVYGIILSASICGEGFGLSGFVGGGCVRFGDYFNRVGGSGRLFELFGCEVAVGGLWLLLPVGEGVVFGVDRFGGLFWWLEFCGQSVVKMFDRGGRWVARCAKYNGRLVLHGEVASFKDFDASVRLSSGELVRVKGSDKLEKLFEESHKSVDVVRQRSSAEAYAMAMSVVVKDIVQLQQNVIQRGLGVEASDKEIERALKVGKDVLDRVHGKAVQRTHNVNVGGESGVSVGEASRVDDDTIIEVEVLPD